MNRLPKRPEQGPAAPSTKGSPIVGVRWSDVRYGTQMAHRRSIAHTERTDVVNWSDLAGWVSG